VVPQDPLTEHPPTPPQWGQRFADLTVHAVAAGPRWRQSAVILNYDESGGFYDHVTPPAGYGFRVPCTVASPFAKAGHVSHATYDHASVLALVERTFGLAPLTDRDAAADPLTDCFDFSRPTSSPITFPAAHRWPAAASPPTGLPTCWPRLCPNTQRRAPQAAQARPNSRLVSPPAWGRWRLALPQLLFGGDPNMTGRNRPRYLSPWPS